MRLSMEHLPRTARDLVELIGPAATWRLVEARAGQMLLIPKCKRARGLARLQDLADIVGMIAAKKIAHCYGGEYLTVPSCKRAIQAVRDAELQARFDALLKAGMGSRRVANQLAGEFGMDATTVYRVSKRRAADIGNTAAVVEVRQGDLFAAAEFGGAT